MAPDTLQPLLFHTEAYAENCETKPPALVITIDGTPSYDLLPLADSYSRLLGGHEHRIILPPENRTPINLLTIPEYPVLNKKIFASSCQRIIEATDHTYPPRISIIFETPISSIAWLLFEKVISGPSDEITTIIKTNKCLLCSTGQDLETIPSIHIVRLLSLEKAIGPYSSYFSTKEIATLEKQITIFNGCLTTAAKIGSRYLKKGVQTITD